MLTLKQKLRSVFTSARKSELTVYLRLENGGKVKGLVQEVGFDYVNIVQNHTIGSHTSTYVALTNIVHAEILLPSPEQT